MTGLSRKQEGREGGERRERGTKSQKKKGKEGGTRGPLAKEGGLYLDISAGVPEFRVTLMGQVCLLGQGPFEEPVRPW